MKYFKYNVGDTVYFKPKVDCIKVDELRSSRGEKYAGAQSIIEPSFINKPILIMGRKIIENIFCYNIKNSSFVFDEEYFDDRKFYKDRMKEFLK